MHINVTVALDHEDITMETNNAPVQPDNVETVRRGLTDFNRVYAGDDYYEPLAIFLRDESETIVGGLLGVTYWGWMNVDILWISDNFRGYGYGTTLLELAEREAVRHGCHHAHTDTMSFQSLPFYLKRGYMVFGQLDDLPIGHSRYFLKRHYRQSKMLRSKDVLCISTSRLMAKRKR